MSQMKIDRRGALTVMVGALLRPSVFTFPREKCILPQRGDLVIYEDENKDRPLRTKLVAKHVLGLAVLDNRRVLLAKF